ncbi:unnamed protein product [Closterium sp. NIES-53]
MVRHCLDSGLPDSLAPLPRSPAPPCTPFVQGRQRAAPHSSSFPPTTAPFQALHLDVWGPSPVLPPRQEHYFLIVVDDYSRYTTVFPLRWKADVPTILEPRTTHRPGHGGFPDLHVPCRCHPAPVPVGTDSPCVLCVGGKLARHTFPDRGSDADDAVAVEHIELCGLFRVAAKDGSLYFLFPEDRKTHDVWKRPVAKKSDVLREFEKWLLVAERQTKMSVLMLRSDCRGEFLGKQFTNFVDGKGIIHDFTCPYTPQQNGMVEQEMRTVAVWVRNCLERSTLPPGMTPYQLLTGKKPNLTLAWVWGCMAQFLVPKQRGGGKLKPKARWGLHLGVSKESRGWEILDLTDNRVFTMSNVVFYEMMSLEVWKSEQGPASGRTLANPLTDTSTATLPLLAEVSKLADEDTEDVRPPSPSPAPPAPTLLANLHVLTLTSASGDEGSSGASPVAAAKGIAGGQCCWMHVILTSCRVLVQFMHALFAREYVIVHGCWIL